MIRAAMSGQRDRVVLELRHPPQIIHPSPDLIGAQTLNALGAELLDVE
jgi:hypothetical protein